MDSGFSSRNSVRRLLCVVLAFGIQTAVAVPIGKISNVIFNTTDIEGTLLNATCQQCSCAALINGMIGWNCIVNERVCHFIRNFSSPDAYLVDTPSGFFFFREVPYKPTQTSTTAQLTGINSTTTATVQPLQWITMGVTVAGSAAGLSGVSSSRLNGPYSVTLDSANNLYICDRFNDRVQRWLVNATNGTTVAGLANGTSGASLTTLNQPASVVLDGSGNMYLTDRNNHRVLFWTAGAVAGSVIIGTGIAGNNNSQLNHPAGIVRDASSGVIYVADCDNHRIMRYLPGASSGTVVAGGNGGGSSNTKLYFPHSFVIDVSTNSFIIVNNAAHTIVRWVMGATSWTLLAGVSGSSGSSAARLYNPLGVALDHEGNIYVADSGNHRIQFYVAGQSIGQTIAGVTGSSGSSPSRLSNPSWVALDEDRNVYVADFGNDRVQKFASF